jgi:hypothetical protein
MGRPKSGLTQAQLVARSEAKRGVRMKSFKLPNDFISEFEQTAKALNIPQYKLLMEAFALYKAQKLNQSQS